MEAKRYWERVGQSYQEHSAIIPWAGSLTNAYIRHVLKGALRRFGGRLSGKNVLEIGCGKGYWFEHYRAWCAAKVHGVDLSRAMLCSARTGEVVEASATHLPFKDDSFDIVITITVLQHLPSKGDLEQSLREIRRVLKKKDGHACLVELSRSRAISWFSPLLSVSTKEWKALLDANGFFLEAVYPVDPSLSMFSLDWLAQKVARLIHGVEAGGWSEQSASRGLRLAAALYYLAKDALAIPAVFFMPIARRLWPRLSSTWVYVLGAGDAA